MSKFIQNNDDLDNFFREKYANDSIEPSPELWENINKNLKYKNIATNYNSILKLKIAIVTLAIILFGTIFYFETILQNEKRKAKNELVETNKKWKDTLIYREVEYLSKKKSQESKIGLTITNSQNRATKYSERSNNNLNKMTKNKQNTISKLDNNFFNQKKTKQPVSNFVTAVNKTNNNSKHFSKSLSIKKAKSVFHMSNNNSDNNQIVSSLDTCLPIKSLISTHKIILNSELENKNRANIAALKSTTEFTISPSSRTSTKKNESKLNQHLAFEFNLAPMYSYRSLTKNPAFYTSDFGVDYYNSREKGNFSYSSNLLVYYQLNKNWKLASGISYFQYAQKMQMNSFDIKQDTKSNYYIYTSTGRNNISISSSIPVNKTDFLKSSAVFSFISIPLLAEYRFSDKYFVNAGLNYSILTGKSVNWKAENFEGDFSVQTNDITGLNTSNLNFILGVGTEKSISKHLYFVVNPSLTMFATSITQNLSVKTYPYSVKLNLGLRYKL